MLALARDGFTEDEVKKILHSSNRNIKFEYNLLDKNDIYKKTLDTVKSCRVSYSSLGQLKSSASIKMKEDQTVDYLSDRIQPFVVFLRGKKKIKFPLGIFLLNSPKRKDENNTIYREIECYSKLQILIQDKFGERYFIPKGTNYITAIAQIIASTGETKINLVPKNAVLQTDKEFDIEKSKLEIVNELLKEINYYSLRVDEEGYFVSNPYVLPVDRTIEYEYVDNELSVIGEGATEELDLFNVPNVFVRYVNNPERPDMRSEYINDNKSSITSTVSRGMRIVDMKAINDIASQSDLDDLTRRDAYNASQVYGHVTFETAIMPFHEYLDCLYLRYNRLGINDKYIETSWEIDCKAGSKMRHTVRKVVNI
ncbi:hypothetical protein [Inediibacterium massiliense]|uniref:hypothetical protein n=1 Tax=Inediibacterium massiliense TaxID=1658111 RepID=UPI0006B61D23|nr:hypothetical protein [Inediibacterium massiliense]